MNTSSMLQVGSVLRGIYRIEKQLASGGFGNTYMATNIEFGDQVAIKEFFVKGVTERDETTGSVSVSNITNYEKFRQQKEKFKKEARRLRQFNNPHIVSVHDLFEDNGTAYYVMDYIDGESLSERMKRTGKPLTEQEVKGLLPQILYALKTVHDEKLWHLDIKPGNIMMDKSGNAFLIDFGASKQMDTERGGATAKTAIAYTSGYAPREQIEQNYSKFGPWTDIYALGATLYAVLTNNHPPIPSAIDDDESPDKHVALPFPDGVSHEMRNLVLFMMRTNRTQRPQSVDVLIHAFNTAFASSQREGAGNANRQAGTNANTHKQRSEETHNETEAVSEETMFKSGTADEKTKYSAQSRSAESRQSSKTKSEETAFTPRQTNSTTNSSPNSKPSYQPVYDEDDSSERALNNFIIVCVICFLMGLAIYCILQCSSPGGSLTVEDTNNAQTETFISSDTSDDATYGKKDVTYPNMGTGVYEGGLQNGEPHGHGTINYSSGMSFTGDFQNGQAHGHGVLKSSTGTVLFDGTYDNGSRKEGTTIYEDGRTFTGTYDWDGTRKEGTLKSANGEVLFKGTFSLSGYYDTGYGKEEGGSGVEAFVYVGNFKDLSWNGEGTITWPNEKRSNYGYKYKGNFVSGERSGYGKMYFNNGGYYEGEWRDGKRSGNGTEFYADHTYKTGIWENDKLVTETERGTWN